MVSLSSRRFKRRSNEKPAEPTIAAGLSPAPNSKTRDVAEQLDPTLLSRLHRVTESPVERRRLGDRKARTPSEMAAEPASAEPDEIVADIEPTGPAPAAVLAEDEPDLPAPIPIHRRSSRANASDAASSRGGAWSGSSHRVAIPGLTEDEVRVLEASRSGPRGAINGQMRSWSTSRGSISLDNDLALANELSAVVRELLFCANSGQLLHGFALYSDAFLFRTMDDSGLNEDEFKAAHQQVSAKPIRDWTRLADLRDIDRHADNVVTATVVYGPAASGAVAPRERFRFMKNDESGAWMIDDIEPIDE